MAAGVHTANGWCCWWPGSELLVSCADPQGGREEVVGGHGEGEVRQQRGKDGLLVLWVAQGAAKEKGAAVCIRRRREIRFRLD